MPENIMVNDKTLPTYLDEQASIDIEQTRKSEIFRTSKSKIKHIITKPKCDWKYDKSPGELKIYTQEELLMESLKEHYAARKEELENTNVRLKRILLGLCIEEPITLKELSDNLGELHSSISGYCSTLFMPRHGKKIRHLVNIDKTTKKWLYQMNPLAVKLNAHELSQLAIKRGTFTARDAGLKIPELVPLFLKKEPPIEPRKSRTGKNPGGKRGGQYGPRGKYNMKPKVEKPKTEKEPEPILSQPIPGIEKTTQRIKALTQQLSESPIDNTQDITEKIIETATDMLPAGHSKLTVDFNFNFNFNLGLKK